jgi:hypothetical protein
MAAKRAAAEQHDGQEPDRALTKAEACRVLQVAPTADEDLITKAYWHLARKYRAFAATDPAARERLHQLNKAYITLNPTKGEAPLSGEIFITPISQPGFFDQLFSWFSQLFEQTRARWPEHVGEVAVLTATTTVLTYLALEAGASVFWTVLAAGIAALAIWAPWRRPSSE